MEYMIAGKSLLDSTIYFLLIIIKRMTRQYISTLRTNIANENVSFDFRFKK